VHAENIPSGERFKSNEAYYTFVALDRNGVPVKVPAITPESEEEKMRYDGALRRRQLRLVLAGKMEANDATELKALFFPVQ
jgi:acyl-CoA hydrolase